ncbi:MAG TPA: YutD family protein [Pseudogracilibacillus sp.]|nr:YutD family protein [Pseudogracilibacillus sp.]
MKQLITINGHDYEILENERDAVQEEEISERYSDILKKYDYIVGDWGYGQLRLKGFYEANHPKVSFDTNITMLDDYLYEYCNFGCAYFILKKQHQA